MHFFMLCGENVVISIAGKSHTQWICAAVRLNGKGVGVRIDSHNHCYYERQLKPTPAAAK